MPSHLRFTILGSGTSAGVPVIGCDCRVCTSTDPRDRRLRSGACLEFLDDEGHERVILFDTPPDLREQALRYGLRRCDGILFTHNHVDHIFGLDEVRRFNAVMEAPIDIYADAHTLESLRRIYRHIFDAASNVNPSFVATLIAHRLEPGRSLDLFGLRFTPLHLLHGRLPVLGFRVDRGVGEEASRHRGIEATREQEGSGVRGQGSVTTAKREPVTPSSPDDFLPLGYCTDVSAIPPETWPALRGLNTLFLNALRYRHHPTHFTVDQAIEASQRIGAKRTWFVHMTHDILHADLDPRLPEGIRLAYDGLRLGGD